MLRAVGVALAAVLGRVTGEPGDIAALGIDATAHSKRAICVRPALRRYARGDPEEGPRIDVADAGLTSAAILVRVARKRRIAEPDVVAGDAGRVAVDRL